MEWMSVDAFSRFGAAWPANGPAANEAVTNGIEEARRIPALMGVLGFFQEQFQTRIIAGLWMADVGSGVTEASFINNS
jgi:hypothetical protein